MRPPRSSSNGGRPAQGVAQLSSLPAADLVGHLYNHDGRADLFREAALVLAGRERNLADAEAELRAGHAVADRLLDEISADADQLQQEARVPATTAALVEWRLAARDRRLAVAEDEVRAARQDAARLRHELGELQRVLRNDAAERDRRIVETRAQARRAAEAEAALRAQLEARDLRLAETEAGMRAELQARDVRLAEAEAEAQVARAGEAEAGMRAELQARDLKLAEAEAEISRAGETEAALRAEVQARDLRLAEAEAQLCRAAAETEADTRARLQARERAVAEAEEQTRRVARDSLRDELLARDSAIAAAEAKLLRATETEAGLRGEIQSRDRAVAEAGARLRRAAQTEAELQARDGALAELQAQISMASDTVATLRAKMEARIRQVAESEARLLADLQARDRRLAEAEAQIRRASEPEAGLRAELQERDNAIAETVEDRRRRCLRRKLHDARRPPRAPTPPPHGDHQHQVGLEPQLPWRAITVEEAGARQTLMSLREATEAVAEVVEVGHEADEMDVGDQQDFLEDKDEIEVWAAHVPGSFVNKEAVAQQEMGDAENTEDDEEEEPDDDESQWDKFRLIQAQVAAWMGSSSNGNYEACGVEPSSKRIAMDKPQDRNEQQVGAEDEHEQHAEHLDVNLCKDVEMDVADETEPDVLRNQQLVEHEIAPKGDQNDDVPVHLHPLDVIPPRQVVPVILPNNGGGIFFKLVCEAIEKKEKQAAEEASIAPAAPPNYRCWLLAPRSSRSVNVDDPNPKAQHK